MKKQGFTLAEVLTTLMVIGVVAAMTIPTLMNSTSDQQNKVALKKAISVLGQAVQLNIAKEVDCTEADSGDDAAANAASVALAACMAHSISGVVNGNQISTPDGMVYTFYADKFTGDLEESCEENFIVNSQENFAGAGQCGVIVDTNGYSKGSRSIPSDVTFNGNGFNSAAPQSGDQFSLVLTAAGAKPIFTAADDSEGYEFMYGDVADSDVFSGALKTCFKCEGGFRIDSKPANADNECEGDGYDDYSLTYCPPKED